MADYLRDFQVSYGRDGSCTIRFRCFDTPDSVTVYDVAGRERDAEHALIAAKDLCLELHFLWSFSLPASDVSRLNEPVARVQVDPRTALLVQEMKAFNALEPAFDFTVGPVSYLWKHAESVPAEEDITAALAHVGADKVEVSGCEVVKADPAVQVDVGGAAKGLAADEVAALLRRAGIGRADIDLGGNLYMMGDHPEGRPWRVSVKVPDGVDADSVIVEVADESVVTSGSYERFTEIDGKRYQHIIDPRTGWPSDSDIVSATVVARSSLEADMLATALLLAGSQGFGALAGRHPACRLVAITAAGAVLR